jgi:hypothetical protein
MENQLLEQVQDIVGRAAGDLLKYAIFAVIVIVIIVVARKVIRSRKGRLSPPEPELRIDVDSLSQKGPPPGAPILEHYHVPVRLAAVVLAPAGHMSKLPSFEELPEFVDRVVPGLARAMTAQRPIISRWPPQLSTEGFIRAFFANVKLPGDNGKGTPWCSMAGRVDIERQSFMVGLVMRADADNNFGRSVVTEAHEWLGILRVKGKS